MHTVNISFMDCRIVWVYPSIAALIYIHGWISSWYQLFYGCSKQPLYDRMDMTFMACKVFPNYVHVCEACMLCTDHGWAFTTKIGLYIPSWKRFHFNKSNSYIQNKTRIKKSLSDHSELSPYCILLYTDHDYCEGMVWDLWRDHQRSWSFSDFCQGHHRLLHG